MERAEIATPKFYHRHDTCQDVRNKSRACSRRTADRTGICREAGTFENTLSLDLKCSSEFPCATRTLPEALKDRPLVTFCTGGVRCEKAAPWLISQGFREVYQLDGGILNYFEQRGAAHFRGECFVFDQRLAVDGSLRQAGNPPGSKSPHDAG